MENWMREAADVFYCLNDEGGANMLETWREAVTWLAIQVSTKNKNTRRWQMAIEGNYPSGVREKFYTLSYWLSCGIVQDPHCNVPLQLMETLKLVPPGIAPYEEEPAKGLFMDKSLPVRGPNWVKAGGRTVAHQLDIIEYLSSAELCGYNNTLEHLEQLQYMVLLDDHCSRTGGSYLISAANAWRELQPMDFAGRLLLIASDANDPAPAMMSYYQMAVMGMASYVLTDNEYVASLDRQDGLFAPPTALCTKPFSGGVWMERCWECVMNNLIGRIGYD